MLVLPLAVNLLVVSFLAFAVGAVDESIRTIDAQIAELEHFLSLKAQPGRDNSYYAEIWKRLGIEFG